MITIWQDSPEYGCTDNPSYKWFSRTAQSNGHIVQIDGPFETKEEAEGKEITS